MIRVLPRLVRVVALCSAPAVALTFSARQLGYPVPWSMVFLLQWPFFVFWCWHDIHRNNVARALVATGMERGYLR